MWFHGARTDLYLCGELIRFCKPCASSLRTSASRTVILISRIFLTWDLRGSRPILPAVRIDFPKKQLFRHIFSGEQKETCPFECSNLTREKDWPLQFSAKNPTQPG